MSKDENSKVPAYDYRSGKDGAPYAGDFASTIYEHKAVAQSGQPAIPIPGPPERGDVRPDGKPYHGGVVQTRKAHWH